GRVAEALDDYRAAIAVWDEQGRSGDLSYLEYAELVYEARDEPSYGHALAVLQRYAREDGFPMNVYRERRVWARLASAIGDRATAQLRAREALEQSLRTESPYQKHRRLGLVTSIPADEIAELEALAADVV
ncbi:MAG: hypothetical protein ACLGHP_08940, partial [Vicinamibacteria bacterium]